MFRIRFGLLQPLTPEPAVKQQPKLHPIVFHAVDMARCAATTVSMSGYWKRKSAHNWDKRSQKHTHKTRHTVIENNPWKMEKRQRDTNENEKEKNENEHVCYA